MSKAKVHYATVMFPADYKSPHAMCRGTNEAVAKREMRQFGARIPSPCKALGKGPTCKIAKERAHAAVMKGCSRKKCPGVRTRYFADRICVFVKRGRKQEMIGCRDTPQAAQRLENSTRNKVCKAKRGRR